MSTSKLSKRIFRNLKRECFAFLVLLVAIFVIFNIFILFNKKLNDYISMNIIKSTSNCRDWHDYKFISQELRRQGPGEAGEAVYLKDENEIKRNKELYLQSGFYVLVTDKISVNRSIPDTRHPECYNYQYPAVLPNVSVIVIFHNEIYSILKRTIHSIVNRTPAELLHEIVLVNDLSTNQELYDPLEEYVKVNFPNTKIIIKNLLKRRGLIVTRLEGAEIATGEVLVFFDSHTEVNTNWLPPLLTPIKANRKVGTIPTIDYFHPETFKVSGAPHYSDRNVFDWSLVWHQLPRKVPDGYNKLKPFPNPIMLGCAFAIDRKFFLEELDGYDREFKIWNAENYELSFKLWLCADGLYEVPCSRITHTFRRINPSRANIPYDYLGRNFKRLVEVWFDEYKDAVYDTDRKRYDKINPGNLTRPKALRDRLKCKTFDYFMNHIMPDMKMKFLINKKVPVFASGQLISLTNSSLCMDFVKGHNNDTARLKACQKEDKIPDSQFFRLNFFKNIVWSYSDLCLDIYSMNFIGCHYAEYGNQYWKYNKTTHMLYFGSDDGHNCMAADFEANKIFYKECNINDLTQTWKFTYENTTAIDDWRNIYGYEKYIYPDGADWSSMLPYEYDEECPIK